MVGLCQSTALENTFVGFEGLYDQKHYMSFATILCMIPENVYGRLKKISGNGLAAGCKLFYRKIYGYIMQCKVKEQIFNTRDLSDAIFKLFSSSASETGIISDGRRDRQTDSQRENKNSLAYIHTFETSLLSRMYTLDKTNKILCKHAIRYINKK